MTLVVQRGNAIDGYEYYSESPEVLAYKTIFPDVTDDVAIGTILGMRNLLLQGMEPAIPESDNKPSIEQVVEMIKATIEKEAPPESTGEEPVEEPVEPVEIVEEIAPQIEIVDDAPEGEQVEE